MFIVNHKGAPEFDLKIESVYWGRTNHIGVCCSDIDPSNRETSKSLWKRNRFDDKSAFYAYTSNEDLTDLLIISVKDTSTEYESTSYEMISWKTFWYILKIIISLEDVQAQRQILISREAKFKQAKFCYLRMFPK